MFREAYLHNNQVLEPKTVDEHIDVNQGAFISESLNE